MKTFEVPVVLSYYGFITVRAGDLDSAVVKAEARADGLDVEDRDFSVSSRDAEVQVDGIEEKGTRSTAPKRRAPRRR